LLWRVAPQLDCLSVVSEVSDQGVLAVDGDFRLRFDEGEPIEQDTDDFAYG
jgi:hypothetical protein